MADQPILNHRFKVSFLGWLNDGIALETRFQSVSGVSLNVAVTDVNEGGQNTYKLGLPGPLTKDRLTLTRGVVVGSFVNLELVVAHSPPKLKPTDILIQLLDEEQKTVASWYYCRAYPTKWSTSELNATTPALVIDTVEFKYTRVQPMRI